MNLIRMPSFSAFSQVVDKNVEQFRDQGQSSAGFRAPLQFNNNPLISILWNKTVTQPGIHLTVLSIENSHRFNFHRREVYKSILDLSYIQAEYNLEK